MIGFNFNSVTVFTPSGQFVCKYDMSNPVGIAIDSAGYSLVTNNGSSSLSVYVYTIICLSMIPVEDLSIP